MSSFTLIPRASDRYKEEERGGLDRIRASFSPNCSKQLLQIVPFSNPRIISSFVGEEKKGKEKGKGEKKKGEQAFVSISIGKERGKIGKIVETWLEN